MKNYLNFSLIVMLGSLLFYKCVSVAGSVEVNELGQDTHSLIKGLYVNVSALYGHQDSGQIRTVDQPWSNTQVDPLNVFSLNNNQFGAGISVGRFWQLSNIKFRTEIEYKYHGKFSNQISPAFPPPPPGIPEMHTAFTASAKAQSLFANLYFSQNLTNQFSIYAGGGLGTAFKKTNALMTIDAPLWPPSDSQSHHMTDFAWQIGVGGLYAINPNFLVNIGYLRTDLGRLELGSFYSHPPAIPGRSVISERWIANNVVLGVTGCFN